ncbi:MAG: tyrosine-protein kinase Etk/Wzc [Psychroserpens sp.]|jgi:tyrosine-protein kinase Etk/Wzc
MNNQFNESDQFSKEDEDSIDIKKYLFWFIFNWYWILASVIISLSIAYINNRYTAPQFLVKSTLLIDEENKSLSSSLIEDMDFLGSKVNIENEIAILKSYSLIKKVVDSLHLNKQVFSVGRFKDTELFGEEVPFTVKILHDSLNRPFTIEIRTISSDQIEVNYEDKSEILEIIDSVYIKNSIAIYKSPIINADKNNQYRITFTPIEDFSKGLIKRISSSTLSKDVSIVELSIEATSIKYTHLLLY